MATVLSRARELLTPSYSWTRGKAHRPDKRAPDGMAFCAIGAIRHVARDDYGAERSGAARAAEDVLLSTIRSHPHMSGYGSIPEWNDAQARRKKDVLAMFDEAIMKQYDKDVGSGS